jgi:hypothetical protein
MMDEYERAKAAKRPQLSATQCRKTASPTGFEAEERGEPSSQPVDPTREDSDLHEESDDEKRRE